MSIYGVNSAQTMLLEQLAKASVNSNTSTSSLFQNILASQINAQTNTESGTQTSGLSSLLLASLMSGNSMMLSNYGSSVSGLSSTAYPNTLSWQQQALSGTSEIPSSASKAVNPAITSDEYDRSPALYRQVINQFAVETNPRYEVNKKGHGDTYCNIFMWDVTRAMGAEIPHYVDRETRAPMYYPNVEGASEMNANAIYDWLHEVGQDYGWHEVTDEQAQELANQGSPVVTALRNNSGGHGHVQVVCPSQDGRYDPERGVTIAQAGRNLTSYRPITKIYNASLPKVKYFAHI